MNTKFDELTKSMAQSVTRRAALKKFGIGLAGMVLACFGVANKAEANPTCLPNGSQCRSNKQCCTFVCSNGYCDCLPTGSPCGSSQMCCSGLCLFGICRNKLRFP